MTQLLRCKVISALEEFYELLDFFFEGVHIVVKLCIEMYLVDPVTNFYLCRGTESFVLFIPLGTAWVGHIGDNDRIVQGTSKELAGEA